MSDDLRRESIELMDAMNGAWLSGGYNTPRLQSEAVTEVLIERLKNSPAILAATSPLCNEMDKGNEQ